MAGNSLNFKSIYFQGTYYSPQDIQESVELLATYLRRGIFSDSPFVAFTANNHIKTLITFYAIRKIGRIAVLLDPQNTSFELEELIEDTNPAAIIYLNGQIEKFDLSTEVIFRKRNKSFQIKSDLTDVAMIAYTNAEDGYLKGAMLTEQNLKSEVQAVIWTNHLNPKSVSYALLPYSHLYGFIHGILTPSQSGGTGVISGVNLNQIDSLPQLINKLQVTHFHSVPSIYYLIGKTPSPELYFKSIENFYTGGIQLPAMIFDSFFKKTGKKIREGYGLTECSPAVSGNYQLEDPVPGSFGKAFPNCKIKIVNITGQECNPDEIGEICIQGDMVFKGYFNQETATQKVLKNGWFYSGDYGKKDINGFIYFCGLKKDMINISGNKLYPNKLKRILHRHPNLKNVQINTEPSTLQGNTFKLEIQLKDNAGTRQEEFKLWYSSTINNVFIPKFWKFI